MDKTIVVIGDVHGCLSELDELLNYISYNPEEMRLVFLGDLIERGPDSLGCIKRVRALNAQCVMGNHENKLIRWHKHEQNRLATGKANPMRVSDELKLINNSISNDDMEWLKNLPIKIKLNDYFWAVHAGCNPTLSLDNQDNNQILHIRYVNSEGNPVALNKDKSQPDNTRYWAEMWEGPESIIYGHFTSENCKPRYDNGKCDDLGKSKYFCLGIDTGCCFGYRLTAGCIYPEAPDYVHLVSVPAKKIYYSRE